MSDLNRVQSGQKLVIPARTWNTVLDATEEYLRRRGDMGGGMGTGQAASSTIVLIKNTSGADVDRMNVLGISAPAILPSENADQFAHHPALVGVTPDLDSHAGRFAVTLEPIKNNEIGMACVSGLCVVHLAITDGTDQFADVNNGTAASLKSGPAGSASILWQAGTSGTVLALVKLGNAAGPAGTHVTPKVLGGSGDVADTETWDISAPPPGTDGVKFVGFRLYWSGTSGDPVYQFIRTPEYDSLGALVFVSAEVRSIAFSTGPCAV